MQILSHNGKDMNKYYDKGRGILPCGDQENIYCLSEIEIFKIIIE